MGCHTPVLRLEPPQTNLTVVQRSLIWVVVSHRIGVNEEVRGGARGTMEAMWSVGPYAKTLLGRPVGVLDDESISIGIFEGATHPIPVRIEGWHRGEASIFHRLDRGLPFRLVGYIEHQEVVFRRGSTRCVSVGFREFEMIRCARGAKHHPVEPFVPFKVVQDLETKTVSIERQKSFEVIGRSSDSQFGYGRTRLFVLCSV